MKNTNSISKIAGLAAVFAIMASLVPVSMAQDSDTTPIDGEVHSGVSITTSGDYSLDVFPTSSVPQTTDTANGVLTVSNNDPKGFSITVGLTSSGTAALGTLRGTTSGTLLTTAGGILNFTSTEVVGSGASSLAGGTALGIATSYSTTATPVALYSNDNLGGHDGVCTNGVINVTNTLTALESVLPDTYTGTLTYTISVNP